MVVTGRILNIAIIVSFLLLLAVLVKGFLAFELFSKVSWTHAGFSRLVLLSSAYWLLWLVPIVFLPRYCLALLSLGLVSVASLNGVGPVATVGCILVSSWLLGDAVLRRMGADVKDSDLLAPALGCGILILASALLIRLGWFHTPVAIGIVLTPICMYRRAAWVAGERCMRALRGSVETCSRRAALVQVAMGYPALLYIVTSMFPETGHDALAMHFVIADHVARHASWSFDFKRLAWATMPMNGDWAYALAYLPGGEFAARLLNASLLGVTTWMLYRVLTSLWSVVVARLGLALFVLLPLTYLMGSWLLVESVWTMFAFSAVTCLFLYILHDRPVFILLLSFLAGISMSTKLTTGLLLPALLVSVLWEMKNRVRPVEAFKLLALGAAVFTLVGSFPYWEAYLRTSNPVFPFFNEVFESPYYPASNYKESHWNKTLGFHTLYDVTFNSGAYLQARTGAFGFQMLVLLPTGLLAALALRSRMTAHAVLLAGSYTIVLFEFAPYLRYLAPAIPLYVLICAAALQWARQRGSVVWLAGLWFVLLTSIANVAYLSSAGGSSQFPTHIFFDDAKREQFLERVVPERRVVVVLNRWYTDDMRVGVFGRQFMAQLRAPYYVATWYNREYANSARRAMRNGDFRALVEKYQLTHLIVDSKRQFEAAHKPALDIAEPVFEVGQITVYAIRTDVLPAGKK